jgi:glycosyltransferase involved in cell wall biosynthesis
VTTADFYGPAGSRGGPPSAYPSVCFVAPRAYSALSEKSEVMHVGGAERQQVILGEELSRRGYRVSFVVLDHGQPDDEEIHGIRVFKCYRLDGGVPGLRFFHPRSTGLWNAMKRADADVYYQRGADSDTGLVGHWCHRHGRAFIYSFANEMTCRLLSPLAGGHRERWLFRHGLRQADIVVTQTSTQQRILQEASIASTIIRSCCTWPQNPGNASSSNQGASPPRILWVGRLTREKRPEWLVRLAVESPQCSFDVVAHSNVDSAHGNRIVGQLKALSNVQWHGYIPHVALRTFYEKASVLLCTSESEGFPNVFLEAWSCGRPVLSSVDPDGIVASFGLGRIATSYPSMRDALAALGSERIWWQAAGLRGRAYVEEHHSTIAATDAMDQVIRQLGPRRQDH